MAPVVALCAAALLPGLEAKGLAWQFVATGNHGDAIGALSFDGAQGRLAVGGTRGARVGVPGKSFEQVLRRGPVRDLVFGPSGRLLAATPHGVFEIDGEGRAFPRAPAPGAAARDVYRVRVAGGIIAAATGAGVFVSRDAVHWRRASAGWPAEPSYTVALRPNENGVDCWAVVGGRLWSVELRAGHEEIEAGRPRRHVLPAAIDPSGSVDVALGLPGLDVVAVLPSLFVVRDAPSEPWRRVRPGLPPGARARRLVFAHQKLWLATDGGLLSADALEGPWRRAAPPAGSAATGAVVGEGTRLYVGSRDRVLAPVVGAGFRGLRTPEGDPPIEHVHRVVLSTLQLEFGRPAALRRGARRRGWLPLVSFRLARGEDRLRLVDRDESFVSGGLRRLLDTEHRNSRDFETSLTLAWDLGDIAYHPEEIDASREARELVKLRDDVLDEVTQLYFERRRVLAELATAAPGERLRLGIRAAELAAGIDAWTGGWFSRARAGRL
ncbi:MAG: hypothetical protein VX546_11075 [Myxococcota bacterium]|nr:hypothetical protein [Myxococcota bacterium]